jgi:hypothetical protein
MNNNNTRKRKKKNKEKEDFSSKNKIPKEQNTTRKTDVVDISSGIIDIDKTPDVATWNKESQIKEDAVGVIVNRSVFPEPRPPPPTTIGIGLRDKKHPKKDLIIDPANKKEVEEAIKSGSILTDEADNDLS